jgi:hypothetical protein
VTARTLTVQSVLYGNDPAGIVRAIDALANSVDTAIATGDISSWSLVIGDCSEIAVLSPEELSAVEARVKAAHGEFVHVVFGDNLGHGGGHNRLAPMAESDLILVLNPDSMVAPNTVARLAAVVVGDVGAADGRQLPLEHPKDYDAVTGDESWASGACLMTTRDVFEQVGGFDHETFFMYCDDVDYSWRVRLAGKRVVYQPSARVFHDKRLTVEADIVPSAAEVYYSAEAAVLLALTSRTRSWLSSAAVSMTTTAGWSPSSRSAKPKGGFPRLSMPRAGSHNSCMATTPCTVSRVDKWEQRWGRQNSPGLSGKAGLAFSRFSSSSRARTLTS